MSSHNHDSYPTIWVRLVLTSLDTKRTQKDMLQSFTQIIDLFGGPAKFAREVGMTPGAAKQARRRDSLNAEWFAATARAARKNGYAIDEALLAAIAERSAVQ